LAIDNSEKSQSNFHQFSVVMYVVPATAVGQQALATLDHEISDRFVACSSAPMRAFAIARNPMRIAAMH
jgi:hypothetical protein